MLYFETEVLRIRKALGYENEASLRTVAARQLMDRSPAERHSLTSLSKEALVSPFHFSRQFKNLYGISPMQYLTNLRLRQSVRLLREGESVLDVCQRVGFESPTSFSGLFKKKMGIRPSAFRAKNKTPGKKV